MIEPWTVEDTIGLIMMSLVFVIIITLIILLCRPGKTNISKTELKHIHRRTVSDINNMHNDISNILSDNNSTDKEKMIHVMQALETHYVSFTAHTNEAYLEFTRRLYESNS